MASFTVTCNQCGTEQVFSTEDSSYNHEHFKTLKNDWYFETGKKIMIKASPFTSPPEISIECLNPKCLSEI